MKKLLMLILAVTLTFVAVDLVGAAPTVWNNLDKFTFTKENFADPKQQANQDRISENVWITRANSMGIFNIKTETGYDDLVSPKDTEWAFGSAVDWQTLTFDNWEDWNGSNPPSMVGKDAVLHLISDDIYIDIKFLSWTQGVNRRPGGGGFSYERSTAPIPIPTTLFLLGSGIVALIGIGKKKIQKI